jgi:CheY-like chemotaxis protein
MLAVVLDEDAAVRQVVCRLLERAGLRAVEARDSAEANAIVQTQPVDLLVAELAVAGLDGRLLASRLTAERPSLAVVLISGDHAPDDEQGHRLGGLRIVQKPFTASEFMQAAMEVISERRGASEGDR